MWQVTKFNIFLPDEGITVETTDDGAKFVIWLSMLFKWYSSDFGKDEKEIVAW